MTSVPPARMRLLWSVAVCLAAAAGGALALQEPQGTGRFDALVIPSPTVAVSPRGVSTSSLMSADMDTLPAATPLDSAWRGFRVAHGERWKVVVDSRSGAPLLVEGEGIPWIAGSGNVLHDPAPPTIDSLAAAARAFVAGDRTLFKAVSAEMLLSRSASAALSPDLWQIQFDHMVGGVPVAGDRYVFYVGHGNLVAFGASRWTPVVPAVPAIGAPDALTRLRDYMQVLPSEAIEVIDAGSLEYESLPAGGGAPDVYEGSVGSGYDSALCWKIVLRVAGDAGTWTGLVDARTGAVLALYDDNRYAQVKGGVYPTSNDLLCPDGCEQGNYPLPWANVTINGSPQSANAAGVFTCSPSGGTGTTTLQGTYVKVVDVCGAISQSVTCDADLDLKTSAGTDCAVPAGASAGNTHSARTSYYHLNRIKEHARAWLPSNTWLTQQLTDNVNVNLSCNAFWNSGGAAGTVNFYRAGTSCRNSGEIAGVFLHEWGHGLDQNDGGGYDNPSEAYADITAFLSTHASCIGRGFRTSGQCAGYGNSCLNCTGVRDVDWNQHADHAPSTGSGFVASHCGSGSSNGPCGREGHCESYISSEAVWDLAARDLPASGFDQNTAWQITDRLWYKSRTGSGGNAYTCTLPNSNGCAATSWFSKFRVVDDDDGNLANGTPHAAAIFAAFDRHRIACGAAGDATNQNSGGCPALAAPALSAASGSGSASLSWTAVPGASSYNILKNDYGCAAGFTILATPAGTTYNDTGLANGFTQYYSVQAVGANSACLGALSNCLAVAPGSGSNADLAVTNSDSPDPAQAGQSIAYTVSVTNGGPSAAASAQLSGATPPNTTFQSIAPPVGWSCTNPAVGGTGAISCTAPSLAATGSVSFTIVVKVNVCAGNGTSIAAFTASSANTDPAPGNNTAVAPTTLTDPGTCNDGNACTQTDVCQFGACAGTNPVSCTASDTCHTAGVCDTGTGLCSNPAKPEGASCNDGNGCTRTDTCKGGVCTGASPVVCSSLDQCHTAGVCSPGTGLCSNPPMPDGNPCDDGSSCTTGDACQGGVCNGAAVPPPADVNDTLVLTQSAGATSLAWSDAPGPFNLYRGSRGSLAPWAYNQTCRGASLVAPASDTQVPPPGDTFFYLVSRKDACGESAAGRDSLGVPAPNPLPCP